jgi:hypothetical protein
MLSIRALLTPLGSAAFALGIIACGDDTASSTSSTSSSTTGAGGDATTTGGGGSGGAGGGGTGGAADMSEYNGIVIGTLKEADLAKAKMGHDMLAAGGEAQSKMLGSFGHFALLGTTVLGTKQDEFLGVDRWHGNNMDKVYDDPTFQAAFGSLFSAPPILERYKRQTEWAGYGDLDAGKAFPTYFFVVFRGTLADPSTAQKDHDAAVGGAKDKVMAAGGVGHAAFLERDDATKAAFIDIWKDSTNIMATYTDPGFQMVFAKVFKAQPSIGVYQSTDWHQW